MVQSDRITKEKHLAFIKASESFDFECQYISKGSSVHAKVHVWMKAGKHLLAYTGSANSDFLT